MSVAETDSKPAAIRDRVRELRRVPAGSLVPNPKNWREHPEEQRAALRQQLSDIGYADTPLCRELPDGRLMLIDGHLRQEETPPGQLIPVLIVDCDEGEADRLLATLDPLAGMARTNESKLNSLLASLGESAQAIQEMMRPILEQPQPAAIEEPAPLPPANKLADKFVVPPFSVLDARQGYWQERKRAWLSLGIQSEVGRGDNLLQFSETAKLPARKSHMQGMNSHSATPTRNPDGTLNYGHLPPLGSAARVPENEQWDESVAQLNKFETAEQAGG
jgi:hypothetical protein